MEDSARAYYLTRGWLRYENNIWREYQRSVEKYGPERTRSIFRIMLKHYTHLVVIDTGAYDTKSFIEEVSEIAVTLDLTLKVVPAELNLLTQALGNSWSEDFAIIESGQKVTLQDMGSRDNYLSREGTYNAS